MSDLHVQSDCEKDDSALRTFLAVFGVFPIPENTTTMKKTIPFNANDLIASVKEAEDHAKAKLTLRTTKLPSKERLPKKKIKG